MIIDSHVHIFPEEIVKERKEFFKDEPSFELLYNSPNSRLACSGDLLDMMDANNIDHAFILGFPWRNINTARMHNDYLLEMSVRYADRLSCFCCVDTFADYALQEVERVLNCGAAGIGEMAFYGRGFDEEVAESLAPVMAICREKNAVIILHTNEQIGRPYPGKVPMSIGQIYDLISRFNKNKLVLSHMGGGLCFFHLMTQSAGVSFENVFYDTAAVPFLYEPIVYQIAMASAGMDKFIFGSDFPLINPSRYFNDFVKASLPPDLTEALLYNNAKNIFHLPSKQGS